jgi:hypothetical protein
MAHSSWWRTPAGERFEFRQRLVSTWESLLVRGLVRGNSLRYFFSANPSRADLSGVDLSDGNLFSVSQDWAKAKLSGANLSGAKAPTVFFVEANLGGANLSIRYFPIIEYALDRVVTLPCEREVSPPQELSGRSDCGPPCVHRRGAQHAVRLG